MSESFEGGANLATPSLYPPHPRGWPDVLVGPYGTYGRRLLVLPVVLHQPEPKEVDHRVAHEHHQGLHQKLFIRLCFGSMTFWCGSGSADPCL
jgi:hypothetical protein